MDLEEGTLCADVIFVDEVVSVASIFESEVKELLELYHSNILPRQAYSFRQNVSVPENATNAFWRTIIADRDSSLKQVDKLKYRCHFMAFCIELLGKRYPAVGKTLTRLFFRRKSNDGNAHFLSIISAVDLELPSTKIKYKQETETSSLVTYYVRASQSYI
jgi:hypothetical protein